MPPTILVSPAAFKGSFSPRQVADAIVSGVRRALPGAVVLSCPAADGGDGLLDAVLPPGSFREHVRVTGPLGVPVSAELGWLDAETAILESASACGLALLKPEERDPLRATTRGVGELIFEAVDRGARTVIVGLGGSATVDGGTGAARGLGWTFQDWEGAPLPEGGGALFNLTTMRGGWGLEAKLIALTDVTTPLLGSDGAAPVFGPQKGATAEQVRLLAAGLERLGMLWGQQGRPDLATLPGGGAAGGPGGRLGFFAQASLPPRARGGVERGGFDAALGQAGPVVTGEGTFDRTSLAGKAAGEVLRRAQAAKKKVAVVAGRAIDLIGAHTVSGQGETLDLAGVARLGEQAAREALGVPVG